MSGLVSGVYSGLRGIEKGLWNASALANFSGFSPSYPLIYFSKGHMLPPLVKYLNGKVSSGAASRFCKWGCYGAPLVLKGCFTVRIFVVDDPTQPATTLKRVEKGLKVIFVAMWCFSLGLALKEVSSKGKPVKLIGWMGMVAGGVIRLLKHHQVGSQEEIVKLTNNVFWLGIIATCIKKGDLKVLESRLIRWVAYHVYLVFVELAVRASIVSILAIGLLRGFFTIHNLPHYLGLNELEIDEEFKIRHALKLKAVVAAACQKEFITEEQKNEALNLIDGIRQSTLIEEFIALLQDEDVLDAIQNVVENCTSADGRKEALAALWNIEKVKDVTEQVNEQLSNAPTIFPSFQRLAAKKFFKSHIFSNLTEEDRNEFEGVSGDALNYALTRTIYLISFGSEKDSPIPGFLKKETREEIQGLREMANDPSKEADIAAMGDKLASFGTYKEGELISVIYTQVRGLASEEMQGGIVMHADVWNKALEETASETP